MARRITESKLFLNLLRRAPDYAYKIKELESVATDYLGCLSGTLLMSFTKHDITHSQNIVEKMEILMGFDKLSDSEAAESTVFSIKEVYYSLACAMLHDCGMIVSEQEKNEYLQGTNKNLKEIDIKTSFSFRDYESIEQLEKAKIDFLKTYIRKKHGERSRQLIEGKTDFRSFAEIIKDDLDKTLIGIICESHCLSLEKTKTLLSNYTGNDFITLFDGVYNEEYCPLYVSLLLRISDALDFCDDRAPSLSFDIYGIQNITDSRHHWKMNQIVSSVRMIRESNQYEGTGDNVLHVRVDIKLFPESRIDDETAYYKVKAGAIKYFNNVVNSELSKSRRCSIDIVNKLKIQKPSIANRYFIDVCPHVHYQKNDNEEIFSVNMNYSSVLDNLLGFGLYGDARTGMREVIQNSIDAINWKYSEIKSNTKIFNEGHIDIEINTENDYVIIKDDGIGMDIETITNIMLGIGKSIYSTDNYKSNKTSFQHIGEYGIGFFSVFMLCDFAIIESKKYGTNIIHRVLVNSDNENFFVSSKQDDDFSFSSSGTRITLRGISKFKEAFKPLKLDGLNKNDEQEQCYGEHVKHYIEGLFLDNEPVRITINVDEILSDNPTSIIDGMVFDDAINKYHFNKNCELEKLSGEIINYKNSFVVGARYGDLPFCGIYQWDKSLKKFAKIDAWDQIIVGENECVQMLSVPNWKSSNSLDESEMLLLYIPNSDDTFSIGHAVHKQIVLYKHSFIVDDYSLDNLIEDLKINPIMEDKKSCVCTVDKYLFKRVYEKLFILKEKCHIEETVPLAAIKSGVTYRDKIYIRNVLIKDSHLNLPYFVVGFDGKFTKSLDELWVNILHPGIIPNLKRDKLVEKSYLKSCEVIAQMIFKNQLSLFVCDEDMIELYLNRIKEESKK